jgi:hypothetical protein
MLFRVLALLALLASPAAAQNVPYFPQILPSGTIMGRLTTGAGPVEAIPKSLWLSSVTSGVFTQGSVLFSGVGGLLTQDNANFYWDDTNNRLGINTAGAPSAAFHLVGNALITGNLTQTGNVTVTGTISGTTVSGGVVSGTAVIGSTVSAPGILVTGSSSGTITVQGQASDGTYNFNLPTTAGSSGQFMASGGGTTAAMTWVTPNQITGTATNDAASAGNIGEFVAAQVVSGSAVGLTTATAANVTSISLTAGDWEVCGSVFTVNGGSTVMTQFRGGWSTTSATLPTSPATGFMEWNGSYTTVNQFGPALSLPCDRLSLASTTTVYLVAQETFTTSTASAYGRITARRRR